MTFCAILFSALISFAPAQASTGKTADGCTYRVINGQYLTSCEKKAESRDNLTYVAPAPAPRPLTSYDAVPVRNGPAYGNPPQISAPPTINITNGTSALVEERETYETKRRRERDSAVDSTYVGAYLGSTTIKEAGSGTGLGVQIGTNLDDYYGFELGYSYAYQDVSLGSDSGDLGQPGFSSSDASLRTHLISAEAQGHLTDTFKRLRPFLGLGLGWKFSSLEERASTYGSTGSSLSQSSLGALASAGTKFRISQAFQLGFTFRYFLPLARQESKLKAGKSYDGLGETGRLTRADDALTGAGQYQIFGGVQYAF